MIDPRLTFLARASVANILVDAGELPLGVAFDNLVPSFIEIIGPCRCEREIYERLCRPPARQHWRRRAA